MSQMNHLPYIIYLLRVWNSSEMEKNWHFSLEDPHTHARRGFATLDEMVFFLQQETKKELRNRHES